jgi:hypothetical protein
MNLQIVALVITVLLVPYLIFGWRIEDFKFFCWKKLNPNRYQSDWEIFYTSLPKASKKAIFYDYLCIGARTWAMNIGLLILVYIFMSGFFHTLYDVQVAFFGEKSAKESWTTQLDDAGRDFQENNH